ncbi:MAG: hypothetical protein MJE77_25770, partial [Proteobacteria bacterium]|nr:hypothetical protein [Pseudomonadota bacterium]
ATRDYAPSHITAPSTWSYRNYPEEATYRDGHIGVYWRKHQSWHDVTGTRSGHTLALDEFLRVKNRVTGKTEVLSAAQVVALSDDHRASAQFAKLTLITLAIGGALVGTSKTLLGKVATGLFEIVLPAAGQYVADHEHQIVQMRSGRAFLRAWQIFNLSMAGFGVARLAWGPGRAVVQRLRHSADELAQTNPGNAIAVSAAEHVRGVDDAVAELSGAARVVELSADQSQATRLLDALGDAGMDANRLTALSDDAVVALRDADTAMGAGQLQHALRRLDEAGLSASEREAVEDSLTAVRGDLITDAATATGKPTLPSSHRMLSHKSSRQRGDAKGQSSRKTADRTTRDANVVDDTRAGKLARQIGIDLADVEPVGSGVLRKPGAPVDAIEVALAERIYSLTGEQVILAPKKNQPGIDGMLRGAGRPVQLKTLRAAPEAQPAKVVARANEAFQKATKSGFSGVEVHIQAMGTTKDKVLQRWQAPKAKPTPKQGMSTTLHSVTVHASDGTLNLPL